MNVINYYYHGFHFAYNCTLEVIEISSCNINIIIGYIYFKLKKNIILYY